MVIPQSFITICAVCVWLLSCCWSIIISSPVSLSFYVMLSCSIGSITSILSVCSGIWDWLCSEPWWTLIDCGITTTCEEPERFGDTKLLVLFHVLHTSFRLLNDNRFIQQESFLPDRHNRVNVISFTKQILQFDIRSIKVSKLFPYCESIAKVSWVIPKDFKNSLISSFSTIVSLSLCSKT